MLNFTSLANVCLSVAELLSPPKVIPRPTNASKAVLDAISFNLTVLVAFVISSFTVKSISPALLTVYAPPLFASGFAINR